YSALYDTRSYPWTGKPVLQFTQRLSGGHRAGIYLRAKNLASSIVGAVGFISGTFPSSWSRVRIPSPAPCGSSPDPHRGHGGEGHGEDDQHPFRERRSADDDHVEGGGGGAAGR